MLTRCDATTPMDALEIEYADIENDTLFVEVRYFGCSADHPLGACWDGEVVGDRIGRATLSLVHDDLDDDCREEHSANLEIDLSPVREATSEAAAAVEIILDGYPRVIRYTL